MPRMYKALMKAEKEHRIEHEELEVFDMKHKSEITLPVPFQLPFRIEEEYHRMKQKLVVVLPDARKALLFSCCSQGEGVTSNILGFAITLARGSEKVLLVDSNFRHPTLHDYMNIEMKKGLVELILGECTLEDVMKPTNVNNLKVITAGIHHSNPFSLLESAPLEKLIEQMELEADWVLFDSSPINLYSESVVLASKMDGIIMVIQSEKTRWQVAQEAKKRIVEGRGNVLGVILNRRKMYIPEWAYKLL